MRETLSWVSLGLAWGLIIVNFFTLLLNTGTRKRLKDSQKKLDRLLRDLGERPRVVYCRDCEYRKKAEVNEKGFLICPASGMEITDYDYCSYGERGY